MCGRAGRSFVPSTATTGVPDVEGQGSTIATTGNPDVEGRHGTGATLRTGNRRPPVRVAALSASRGLSGAPSDAHLPSRPLLPRRRPRARRMLGRTEPEPLSPTPAPSPPSPAADFSIDVSPPDEPAASRMAIPGSRYCFLVVVTDPAGGSTPVDITATAEKATVLDITPASIAPGVVGEVCVAADPTDVETTGSVTITATRDGVDEDGHPLAAGLPDARRAGRRRPAALRALGRLARRRAPRVRHHAPTRRTSRSSSRRSSSSPTTRTGSRTGR